jgi:hypothetical protein
MKIRQEKNLESYIQRFDCCFQFSNRCFLLAASYDMRRLIDRAAMAGRIKNVSDYYAHDAMLAIKAPTPAPISPTTMPLVPAE